VVIVPIFLNDTQLFSCPDEQRKMQHDSVIGSLMLKACNVICKLIIVDDGLLQTLHLNTEDAEIQLGK
jgi:hypothetical protein